MLQNYFPDGYTTLYMKHVMVTETGQVVTSRPCSPICPPHRRHVSTKTVTKLLEANGRQVLKLINKLSFIFCYYAFFLILLT